MRIAFVIPVLLTLTACGPVSREQAERDCLPRARLAEQPRGEIRAGMSSDGPTFGGEISISTDYIMGRDPAQIYDQCVMAKSGELPSRPYFSKPGTR